MSKAKVITMLLMLVSMAAWGQEFVVPDVEYPEKELKVIERKWADTPIKVEPAGTKAGIHDFAKAFCKKYQSYVPNLALVDYLKTPGEYSFNEKHYMVDDAPRNGYIKCDMGYQCDYMTEMCYWRLADGHSLVGVLMQVGHEGEGAETDYALLFYNYNPATKTMTPATSVCQTVKRLLTKHKGTSNLKLPREGKDIQVTYVEWNEEDDFTFDEVPLKWTGSSFK